MEEKKRIRTFGWGLAGLFALFTIIHFIFSEKAGIPWQLYVSVSVALVNIVYPLILFPLYKLAMLIAHSLGWFNTRLLLGIIYFLIFTPIALIFKILRKDFLNRKIDRGAESYWNKREKEKFDPESMEKQF